MAQSGEPIKCKPCSCVGNWLQFVVALVSLAVAAVLTILWTDACGQAGYGLLSSTSDLRVGGPLTDMLPVDIKAIEKEVIAAGMVSPQLLFPTKGKRVNNLLCATYDRVQSNVDAWSDSKTMQCFVDPKCGPCGDIYKAAYCSPACEGITADNRGACHSEIDDAHRKCFTKMCSDIIGMYTTLAIIFALLMLSVAFAGCAVCTCCGGSSAEPAKSCLLPACGTRGLLGLIGGILALVYLTGPYGRMLQAIGKDAGMAHVNQAIFMILLPCYLGLVHLVWSEGMIYPDWTVHKASKAAPNLATPNGQPVGVKSQTL